MKVVFLKTLKKDIEKLKDNNIKIELKQVIHGIEQANTLQSIDNLNKLRGYYSMTYRIKIREYRLGLYHQNNIVYLARFVKKEDVHQVFPDKRLKKTEV